MKGGFYGPEFINNNWHTNWRSNWLNAICAERVVRPKNNEVEGVCHRRHIKQYEPPSFSSSELYVIGDCWRCMYGLFWAS